MWFKHIVLATWEEYSNFCHQKCMTRCCSGHTKLPNSQHKNLCNMFFLKEKTLPVFNFFNVPQDPGSIKCHASTGGRSWQVKTRKRHNFSTIRPIFSDLENFTKCKISQEKLQRRHYQHLLYEYYYLNTYYVQNTRYFKHAIIKSSQFHLPETEKKNISIKVIEKSVNFYKILLKKF